MLNFLFGVYFGLVAGVAVMVYMEHRDDPRDAPEPVD